MPLKDRKPFKRLKPPQDLKADEELFYLKATQEVFRNYESNDFFERVIMCNSLVWTCALTGKSNLTFQEAAISEEEARRSLKTFPLALKKPLLYLASLTQRKRLNDMCDDVFNFVKERFFIGEEVDVIINGIK
ncbi:bromodomain adjacent to zinc finger domain protein 1A [Caerostris extrusa]|uniref:Bromodomain adjacent to zinc finger domain protein 1A n=1 Tax=Caerostris extrusa TaxID=172846 RepID=A0AAV4V2K7_CAEEX|nr:bromodomain adjacent to zinc finger domain protein 1A [Caerostris extrusa]